MKHSLILSLMTGALLACSISASASNTPTSQFGYGDWPYRTTPACQSSVCANCGSSACDGNQCTGVPCTVSPVLTPAPTAAPTVAPTAAVTQKPSYGNGDYTSVSVSVQEQNMWMLVNQDRAANGLSALSLDSELCRLARIKSNDMKNNNYFSHTSPTYGSAADLLGANGYSFNSVGENIAHHSTIVKAQAAFMSSSGHKANILGTQWTKVGIGVAYDNNGFVYVTQLFVR